MILRKNEIKHYSGLESDLIPTLPSGDTFFSTDTNKLYKYNEDELPYLISGLDGAVGPEGPAGGGGDFVDTEFTSAQLLDLINTPVELIPAQGAGTIVFIDNMITKYTFGTTAYSQQGNSSLKIYYSYGITGLPSAADNMAAIDTAQDYYELHNNTINSAGTPTELENTAISSIVLNPITLGDGTIKIRTYYSVVDTSF